mgnify:CR=1 FL=1
MITSRKFLAALAVAGVALPLAIGAASSAQASPLPSKTTSMLQHMVAEEKLAHDVYTTLGSQYRAPVFSRIAVSESRHQASMRSLLAAYGVSDPTAGDAVGTFDDPDLQALYDRLTAQGSRSFADAVAAGLLIERIDISDLDKAIAADPPAGITTVLERLRSGSQNHLAAFSRFT